MMLFFFNVQLRNKYDDDDDFNNLLSPVGNDHLTKLPPHSTALPHYLANKQRTKRCHLLTGSPAVYVFLQASIRRIIYVHASHTEQVTVAVTLSETETETDLFAS